ncbi:MAG: mannonate dehydratase [Verrucomicrobia bacterium]|nr:mannonate dehydratase [Verrucomicrobiota bacterium]
MKLGLGFHRDRISRDNFRFARQAGCTHVVVHLVERIREGFPPSADEFCFGMTRAHGVVWSYEELAAVKKLANDEGLELEAIENIDPSFWSDILLDGPRKQQQLESLKGLLRSMGRLKIPILGYNFSLAGVWGRVHGPFARGGAIVPAFQPNHPLQDQPLLHGQLNNIVYDADAPAGSIATVSREKLWQRLADFLSALVPVAEAEAVRLAAHPDDPPLPTLRQTPRLMHQPEHFDRLLALVPSPANALEFCAGTIQEMPGADVYEAADRYSRQQAIAYVHCRNVVGKVPNYREVFIDEGDMDVPRLLRVLHRNGFDGVIIPDHAPQMTCDAPWHAGMAHALGYLRALMKQSSRSA